MLIVCCFIAGIVNENQLEFLEGIVLFPFAFVVMSFVWIPLAIINFICMACINKNKL
ncbi:hypothetical protein RCZ15_21270 [Capnocytophaga catalasegens]|uniref:Uncharacterized protein n=1 Tax=Capnocytophaga catalasegens TaxID=1004260 RepID=A0AAV5AWW0_9FLAO|nr:hypothetical protein RCZ03_07860 [Capnocytophaga catalasegens]GJM51154.1 hypothetical protein RCZ15_21270 [Capnocytophaga catalasegens]GJM53535.1 hypothetical protein RCZ16_18510 [Capnocytophaga catalasegens]